MVYLFHQLSQVWVLMVHLFHEWSSPVHHQFTFLAGAQKILFWHSHDVCVVQLLLHTHGTLGGTLNDTVTSFKCHDFQWWNDDFSTVACRGCIVFFHIGSGTQMWSYATMRSAFHGTPHHWMTWCFPWKMHEGSDNSRLGKHSQALGWAACIHVPHQWGETQKDHEFPPQELVCLTASNVVAWFVINAHGTPMPSLTVNDCLMQGWSNS